MVVMDHDSVLEVDLSEPDAFIGGPPHAVFAALRQHAPVHWNPARVGTPNGGFWSLTRYDDINALSRDKEDLPSTSGVYPSIDRTTIGHNMMFNDPPVHTRLRKIASRGFSPRVVTHFEEWVPRHRYRDFGPHRADGRVRLRRGGVVDHPRPRHRRRPRRARERRQDIADWANGMVTAFVNNVNDPGGSARAAAPIFDYGFELREIKRNEPADDMITELVTSPEQLTDAEYKDFFVLLVAAGFETTFTTMAQGMREIVEDENIANQVAHQIEHDRSTLAVEEILRYVTPVMEMARCAKRDMEFRGQKIAKDDMCVLWYVAGDRDLEAFQNPNVFDGSRDPNPHMAFGAGGAHFCLGAPLARLEPRLLLEGLHARGMKFRLAGEPIGHPNTMIR